MKAWELCVVVAAFVFIFVLFVKLNEPKLTGTARKDDHK